MFTGRCCSSSTYRYAYWCSRFRRQCTYRDVDAPALTVILVGVVVQAHTLPGMIWVIYVFTEFACQCTYSYLWAQPAIHVSSSVLVLKHIYTVASDGCSDVPLEWPGNAHIGMYTRPPRQLSVLQSHLLGTYRSLWARASQSATSIRSSLHI